MKYYKSNNKIVYGAVMIVVLVGFLRENTKRRRHRRYLFCCVQQLILCRTTTYSVAYNNLFVLHIKATQELKAKNDALQTELKALLQSKGLLD